MRVYDVIVVGAGPAGLTAAMYAARAGKEVLLLEKELPGGAILRAAWVENYPGFPRGSGQALSDEMEEQAIASGVRLITEEVTDVRAGTILQVQGRHGTYMGYAVIIAAGSRHRMLGIAREEALIGRGISYCATCDGPLFRGRDVAVIGGGNTAVGDALVLSEYCHQVTLIQKLDHLTAERQLCELLARRRNVSIRYGKTVIGLLGEQELTGLVLQGTTASQVSSDKEISIAVDGAFVAIGQEPVNRPFRSVCRQGTDGYLLTDDTLMARVPGVFVAGDCRAKTVRQLVTATADGAVAALSACRYVESRTS